MSQVLVPSAWVIRSLPVPPVMSPLRVPAVPMLNVSTRVPPTRFAMPENATRLSVPESAPSMFQVLTALAPVSVLPVTLESATSESMLSKPEATGLGVPTVEPASPSTLPSPLIVKLTLVM